ncbi:MAG: hydroxyacid dehydrogenase [Lachnospiraceae bacterium]|nr:hydroxyacid dehydrogenase [Lachnospiraceae bacterium]
MKVVIMESLGIPAAELEAFQRPFEEKGVSFVSFEKTSDIFRMIEQAKDAEVMILANMPMPAEVIRACTGLKFIDVAFTGVDHVALDVAKEKGIAVSNAAGYSNEAVAELAVGMALSLARNMREVEERCRAGQDKTGLVGWELKGKTVGIVGLGKIGTRSAELFHAFGAHILANSRSTHADAPSFVEQTSLEELLTRSDVVVLHMPLTEETRGMIDKAALSKMKKTAFLINLARGPVIHEADLCAALREGVIAGAAIDVFDKEPPLEITAPILQAPKTLLTPHVAFATEQSMTLRAEIVFENLKQWMEGNQINKIL